MLRTAMLRTAIAPDMAALRRRRAPRPATIMRCALRADRRTSNYRIERAAAHSTGRPGDDRLVVVPGYLGSYATLGLLLVVGAGFFVVAFGANRLLRPGQPRGQAGKLRVRPRPGRRGLGTGPDPLLRLRVPLCAVRGGERLPLPLGDRLRPRRIRPRDRGGDGHLRRPARARPALRVA